MSSPTVTDLILAPGPSAGDTRPSLLSLGLVVDGRFVTWGEVTAPSSADSLAMTTAVATELRDRLVGKLAGLSLAEADWRTALSRVDEINLPAIPGLRLALEQALIGAIARCNHTTTAAMMAAVFGEGAPAQPQAMGLILEVENQHATAELVNAMIHAAPDGLGYRLAVGDLVQSIGPDARYLQRFVRELTTILQTKGQAGREPPLIYLGLAGALGALTQDLRRDMGQVLGNCVGLESAVGGLPLWLEDPIVLDDAMAQTAALHQLHDYFRARKLRAQLIGRAHATTLEGVRMLCETDAVDGVCLAVGEWGSLAAMAGAVAVLRGAGKLAVLAVGSPSSSESLSFYADFAGSVGIGELLVTVGRGSAALGDIARGAIDRRAAWLSIVERNRSSGDA